MKKWLKGLLFFGGFIICVFAIGAVLIVIYKKEILAEVSRQLKSAIHAEVTIGDADITLFNEFPNFTLRLEDVVIRDTSARKGDKDLLNTKTILVNVRTYKLFYKEIEFRSVRIIDGEFYIFRSKSGYSNLDAFKKQKVVADTVPSKADSTADFRLTNERVFFQNLRFTWHDSLKEKYIGLVLRDVDSDVNHFDSLIACRLNGRIDFDELTFNPDRGSFLKNKATTVSLAFTFFTDSKQLRVEPSTLSLNESEIHLEGNVDFADKNIVLDISSDKLLYSEGLSVLPETLERKLSKFSLVKPFGIFVHLDAPMGGGGKQPFVGMRFDVAGNTFKSDVVTITDLSLDGVMTNRQDTTKEINNANSTVHLNNVVGKIDELPFKATAVLSDFNDILLDIHSKHAVTLPMINREVDTTSIRFTKGKFFSEFHYVGKLSEYFDPATGTYKGDLDGKATVENGAFTLVERKLDFKDISMSLRFNEDTMWIDKIGFGIGKSSATIKGLMVDYVPYFTRSNKGFVKLKITSPNIDMQNFLAKKSSKAVSKQASKQSRKKTADMINKLFTMLQFDIDVNIDKLQNKSFAASNISGKVKLNEMVLQADNVKMDLGGGKLNFSLTMKDLKKEITPMDVKATASGIEIKDLFKSFNNFNQKSITDENLEGRISFDTRIKVKLNDDFNLMLPTFSGDMNWILKEGRLINVEAMHNMSNFLFRRRDFDDVRFAQINGNFKLTHRYLDISRMEIQSTVLSIFLEGRYSLDDDTNISVQVPLSNLKKRDKDFVPENVGVDAKVGPSVFLTAKTGDDGKTDISYNGLKLSDKKKEKKKKGN